MIALLLLGSCLQSDETCAEWLRQLADDSIEVRERAADALLRGGESAERALSGALASANAEIRSRAGRLLAERFNRALAREVEPDSRRVMLKAKEASLGDVIEELRRQSPIRLFTEGIRLDDRVTVDVDRLPFFQAVDSLCRRHGSLNYEIISGGGDNPKLRLRPGTFVAYPTHLEDQYAVRLRRVFMAEFDDLHGTRTPLTHLSFEWAWEKGVRPLGSQLVLEAVEDDSGASYLGDRVGEDRAEARTFGDVGAMEDLRFRRFPGPGATRFTRVKGAIEVVFDSDFEVIRMARPLERVGETSRSGELAATLRRFERRNGGAAITVVVASGPAPIGGRVLLASGEELRPTWRYESSEGGIWMSCVFDIPDAVEIRELRIVVAMGDRTRRIPFEFKDVRFR